MEKKQLLKEQQDLKELNKKTFKHSNYKCKTVFLENKDGSMHLQFQLLKKPNSLLPHLEPNMNICYGSIEERNVRNIKEYYECKEKVIKIIDSWRNFNEDEIIHEADRYLKNDKDEKLLAVISINNDLKANLHYFELKKIDKNEHLIIQTHRKGQKVKFAIVEMSGYDFINLGYIDYGELEKIAMEKASKFKSSRVILKINGTNTYKWFYFYNKKSYETLDNCRTSSKYSRTPLNSVIFKKKIMIIGLGALGSHVAELVASLWPKTIVVWDEDVSFSNSSTRQNYHWFPKPESKALLLKNRLFKYKDVEVIIQTSNFPKKSNNTMPKTFDYILDCTGEGVIASEFNEISKYATNTTIIAAAYIQEKLFTKISSLEVLKNNNFIKEWHRYDINNSQKYNQNNVIKGCSEILEYSYLDVYLLATTFVSNILNFKGKNYDFQKNNSLG